MSLFFFAGSLGAIYLYAYNLNIRGHFGIEVTEFDNILNEGKCEI